MKTAHALFAALALGLALAPERASADVYDAVADFSATNNPNGPWSYRYDPNGTGLTLMSTPLSGTGLVGWSNGLNIPNEAFTFKNTSGSTLTVGTVVLPTTLLDLDPQSEHAVDIRWTAPSAGTWTIAGLFQGVDTGENVHPVEILENGQTVLLGPTNISSFGQQVTFSQAVSLKAGDTIDFEVLTGPSFNNLGTGLSATITSSAVPEPSAFALAGLGLVSVALTKWRKRARA